MNLYFHDGLTATSIGGRNFIPGGLRVTEKAGKMALLTSLGLLEHIGVSNGYRTVPYVDVVGMGNRVSGKWTITKPYT
ncbi:MAG: hypothetical protein Q8P44_03700 [Dehalococcoidia bacterium]|nr:hypothetical protein [Dehalococcoidia bacterium]